MTNWGKLPVANYCRHSTISSDILGVILMRKVKSQNGIAQDSKKKVPQIADELNVSFVLEGSIQQSQNHIRLNIQLINGETDDHLWAEIFDTELTAENIFTFFESKMFS